MIRTATLYIQGDKTHRKGKHLRNATVRRYSISAIQQLQELWNIRSQVDQTRVVRLLTQGLKKTSITNSTAVTCSNLAVNTEDKGLSS